MKRGRERVRSVLGRSGRNGVVLPVEMLRQPDDVTCGPTCLQAVYAYWGDAVGLGEVVRTVRSLDDDDEGRGTLGVNLGVHALRRGYRATLYTYNLRVFDPTWFAGEAAGRPALLREKLSAQCGAKGGSDTKLAAATRAYLEFLELGGVVRFEDLTSGLIAGHIRAGRPVLTGLSATYLHRASREFGPDDDADDIRGGPAGHFVVLHGYDARTREVSVADPLEDNPAFATKKYRVGMSRLVPAIMLGVLTHDANLLVIEPAGDAGGAPMKPLLVVDSPKRWAMEIPGAEMVSSFQYLSDPELAQGRGRKVFNLCRSMRYQAAGYYVSLLAEARGHRPLPSVAAMQDLKLAPVVRLVSQDLEGLMQASLRRIKSDGFELSVYFGRNLASAHDSLALAIFNAFPAPLLRAKFEREEAGWLLTGVRVIGLGEVPESHRDFVVEQARRYLKRVPRKSKSAPPTKYDLAILQDPKEEYAPSNPEALKAFAAAGESLGIRCELIEKDAYGRIAEFDGLFIRETTSVNHHTYRFARRASAEGMVVIDDPQSIVRCANKVYLAETLGRHRVPTPKTLVISRENAVVAIRALGLPCVIEAPDSSFSRGVILIDTEDGLDDRLATLFEQSDLLIAQEFVRTDFDWRIAVLGNKPLFACQYGMAKDHWQIYKRDDDGVDYGDSQTFGIGQAPDDVVKLGVRAAGLMGDGLYGVDLKVVHGKAVVIEVNDNPNIDAGVEDAVQGEALYRAVMEHFFWKFEER